MEERGKGGIPEDAEVRGTFVMAIRGIKWPDGKVTIDVQTKNENLSRELVLMHLKAWLHNSEQIYFNRFGEIFSSTFR